MRAQANKAFTAEMDRVPERECRNFTNSGALNDCYGREIAQSESNLNTFRAAIGMSIQARQDLFDPHLLQHFDSTEQAWDRYCEEQAQATADMVDKPADKPSSANATRIGLIRTHMQNLDKLYNILLHNNCGACLVDQ